MAYSNYVNAQTQNTGENFNVYTNYANNPYYSGPVPPAYGYYGTGSYNNYTNWHRPAPAAGDYVVTADKNTFVDYEILDGDDMREQINRLRSDLDAITTKKVKKGVGAGQELQNIPAWQQNSASKFNLGVTASKAQIEEVMTTIKNLWKDIKAESNPSGTWPDFSVSHPKINNTDMINLIDRSQNLADENQPRSSGYLNCAHTNYNYAGNTTPGDLYYPNEPGGPGSSVWNPSQPTPGAERYTSLSDGYNN